MAILVAGGLGVTGVQAGQYRNITEVLNQGNSPGVCDISCKNDMALQAETAREWRTLGLKRVRNRELSAARFAFDQALDLAEKDREYRIIPGVLVSLGGVAFDQKNYSDAISFYESAVKAADHCEDKRNGAVAYLNLGLVQRKIGKPGEAREMFRNSLKLTRDKTDIRLRTNAMFQYGRILAEVSNKVWAEKALVTARNLSEEHGFTGLFRASEMQLAAIRGKGYKSLGTGTGRKRKFRMIPVSVTRTGSVQRTRTSAPKGTVGVVPKTTASWTMRDRDMVKSYDRLGASHMERRQYDMAAEMFKKSIFLNRQMGDKKAEAKAYTSLAGIYARLGDKKNSCNNFWQARELSGKARMTASVDALTQQLKKNNCLSQQASLDAK